jgi:hypothetical protein
MSAERDRLAAAARGSRRRAVETTMLRNQSAGSRRRRASSLCLIAAAALAVGVTTAGADPTVFIQPQTVVLPESTSTTFEVRVDDSGDPISCFIVHLHFDPTVFQVDAVNEGLLYELSGLPTWPRDSLIAVDTLEIYNCVLGSGTFVTGPGQLAEVEITALAPGVSPLEFTFVQVRDIDRIPYGNTGSQGGEVYVPDPTGIGGDAPLATPGVPRIRVSPNPAPGWARVEVLGGTAAQETALPAAVTVDIYDVGGRLCRTLRAGGLVGATQWDGRDTQGQLLPVGLYVMRVRGVAGPGTKLLMIR